MIGRTLVSLLLNRSILRPKLLRTFNRPMGCFHSTSVEKQDLLVTAAPPVQNPNEISDWACFGAGCYWGTEKYFTTDCSVGNTIVQAKSKVGFMGPASAPSNPTYEDVCTGVTGHVEVYNLQFDGKIATYEELVKFFFQFHDPTTKNQQGNDRGTQYASTIFAYDDKQFEIATRIKDELQAAIDCGLVKCFKGRVVSTEILRSTIFYEAKKEHQEYLAKNPKGYCNHRIRLSQFPTAEDVQNKISSGSASYL